MLDQTVKRGKLKLFLGYADGVGKTYAVLEAARQRKEKNVDVVIAWVETHGQADTEAMLAGLELIPACRYEQGGDWTSEMDVDAVLERKPTLAIVDNLAHINSAGMRHPMRYQDVEELLDYGINVYSTLNIIHLESLKDIVLQITGISIQETIPDSIFDEASVIELIDFPPDELLQRFNEGKIFLPDSIAPQADHFFRLGNLIALRELSMRRAAGRVEDQMRDYMKTRDIAGPWPAAERIMVCVSAHPLSERLVRTGQRLATDLNAEWFVVYIETPDRLRFSQLYYEKIARILRLAEELGAKVIKISGRTVPEAVAQFAHRQNITKIIVGNPLRPRWQEIISGSVVDEIIRHSGSIDVFVISDESGPLRRGIPESWRPHGRWARYLRGTLLVAAITILALPLQNVIEPTNLVMIYLAAVLVAAIYLGRGPSMLASLLSVLAFDFFFVHPHFSLNVADTQYLITFFGLLVVGLVVSNLAGLVRDQVFESQQREVQTATLYALSRELTISVDLEAVLQTVIKHVSQTFSREAVILLPAEGGLEIRSASAGYSLDEAEEATANWSFEHNQPAGRGTDTHSKAGARYQPLMTAHGVVGVMGVRPGSPGDYLTSEQRQLLEAYTSLAALAIERAYLAEQAGRAQLVSATEKLQTALLNSISHDLRTPLATITGVFSSLSEAEEVGSDIMILDHQSRQELIDMGWEEARRLNRLVGNLLEMTRLEAGALRLAPASGDVQDVIGSTLGRLSERLNRNTVKTDIQENLPLVSMDFVLVEQVLVNLLDNAVKYSQAGDSIEIQARHVGDEILVTISDHGIGIPPEDLAHIFDKFFRVQRKDGITGTGLGLSICKGIIEAHHGCIWAENRPEGGAAFSFTLPLEEAWEWEEIKPV